MRTLDLKRLDSYELIALFTTLEAPTLQDMTGDFRATVLRQPHRLLDAGSVALLGTPGGRWLSKGFRPTGPDHGRGYNSFSVFGRLVQRYPMATRIAPSRYDGRDAYQLRYAAYSSLLGRLDMVDEVRRIDANRYLGIGSSGPMRRLPMPFLLEGPSGAYIGDIGHTS